MKFQQGMPVLARRGPSEVDVSLLDRSPAASDEPGAMPVLSSAGNPPRLPETTGVAVVLLKLIGEFRGRLPGSVIASNAEIKLGQHFVLRVQPMVVLLAKEMLGLIVRTWDLSIHFDRISTPISRPCGSGAAVVGTVPPYQSSQGVGL
ncbi:hydrogenase accessory protein [Bradyrhizobium sp. Pa8]|uniref:hydrogenase accessory protein n=1 Tax=Bradyrhizobium sp. Pa8 TaxID=3386552 RepID=UPI00403F7446